LEFDGVGSLSLSLFPLSGNSLADSSESHRYDYAGSWDSVANHQANLFGTSPDSLSTDRAIRFYTSQGVPVQKLVLGTSPSLSLFCSCSLTGGMQVFRCTGDHSQTVKDLVDHSKESVLGHGKQVNLKLHLSSPLLLANPTLLEQVPTITKFSPSPLRENTMILTSCRLPVSLKQTNGSLMIPLRPHSQKLNSSTRIH